MTLQEIQQKAETFKKSQIDINRRRDIWRNEIKQRLITTLKTVAKEVDLSWDVQVLDWTTNLEGINICFKPKPSGLSENPETGFRSEQYKGKIYVKNGGAITFAQYYNGQISVVIIYPSVEEYVSQKDALAVVRVEPEEITEAFIYKHVALFLDEMTKWENAYSSSKIGFKTNDL